MTQKDYPIITPMRGRSDPLISPVVVLVFTVEDFREFQAKFENSIITKREIYNATLLNIDYEGRTLTLVGPIIGAPQAVLIGEKLIVMGARAFLAYGWCGSISPKVRIGDIVIAKKAISEEGTSRHYPVNPDKVRATERLVRIIASHIPPNKITCHLGTVWSTDAPYREMASKVTNYQQQGALSVDMETSALLQVAAFRGVDIAPVLLVSDELFEMKWKPGFRSKKFIDNRKLMTNIILNVETNLQDLYR